MARGVRAVTIERGRDPREFTLVAFGGNGPLFATEMARSLEIGAVLVPPAPGVFSALGLLEAEVEHHLVRTFLRPLTRATAPAITAAFGALEREAEALLREEGPGRLELTRFVDLKYHGQSFELTVPLPHRWPVSHSLRRPPRRGAPAGPAAAARRAREHRRRPGETGGSPRPATDPILLELIKNAL